MSFLTILTAPLWPLPITLTLHCPYLAIPSRDANANSDGLLKIYGRNMMLASERVDADCHFSAASIGRAPLHPIQEWRMRCLCDDNDNNPSRVTSPAAAFHKLMTYGLPYAARRRLLSLRFHFSVSIVSLVSAFYDSNSDGCVPV